MNNYNQQKEPVVVYMCNNTGTGISVELDRKPTIQQEAIAMAMIIDCENTRGGCPESCEIRRLLERR